MVITGYIQDYDGESLLVAAPFSKEKEWVLQKRQITQCEVRLDDGRTISAQQRKAIYATLRDIALFTGYSPEETKQIMKYQFYAETGAQEFSLSDVDMTTANEFLNYLIEFCIRHSIPCSDRLLDRAPDIGRYLYACLVHKKCCISGRKAELHHVDAVGRGRDREEIIHKGMRVLPLIREYHTEAHNMGRDSFCDKYKVFGIKLDNYLCKIWNIKAE